MYRFENEKLVLRSAKTSDIDNIVRELKFKDSIGNNLKKEFSREEIYMNIADSNQKNVYHFIVFDKENDLIIGCVVIRLLSKDATDGIGDIKFIVNCKKYLYDVIDIVLEFCFTTILLHKVVINQYETNKIIENLLKEFGFVEEGINRKGFLYNKKWYDEKKSTILINEWAISKNTIN